MARRIAAFNMLLLSATRRAMTSRVVGIRVLVILAEVSAKSNLIALFPAMTELIFQSSDAGHTI